MPPAGFEPALPENHERDTPGAVTGDQALPELNRKRVLDRVKAYQARWSDSE